MNLLCWLGFHKWVPKNNNMRLEFVSKWEQYEVADGRCARNCGAEDEIRRDYYW
jgi:hypothetical protein